MDEKSLKVKVKKMEHLQFYHDWSKLLRKIMIKTPKQLNGSCIEIFKIHFGLINILKDLKSLTYFFLNGQSTVRIVDIN